MAEQGEYWIKAVLEEFGYSVYNIGTEDCFAVKEGSNIALLIEEKDNKYPLQVGYVKVQTVSKYNKFPFRFNQINEHIKRIIEKLNEDNKYKTKKEFYKIIPVFVVSNMLGCYANFLINPHNEGDYKGIFFFVKKGYFRDWLTNFPKVFIGFGGIERQNMYMRGQ